MALQKMLDGHFERLVLLLNLIGLRFFNYVFVYFLHFLYFCICFEI